MNNEQIKTYFNYMKSSGIIADGWIYNGFSIISDKILIKYYHQTKDKMGYIYQKNSSYTISRKTLITELRDLKLRQLLY